MGQMGFFDIANRYAGLVRARARIGLKNLPYNMHRLVQLERLAAAAPT